MFPRRLMLAAGVALALDLAAPRPAPLARLVLADARAGLSDRAFWDIVSDFSEPGGYFRSDNLLSNETTFQQVLPDLTKQVAPGGVYLGVGPEQNFTYIVALRPQLAFIVDIRQQNMLLHLLYKAVAELSADRAEFLSRLFSRKRPAGLGAGSSVQALFDAYARQEPDRARFRDNLREVVDRLTRSHHFTLSDEDRRTIEYVYDAFYTGGPELSYSFPRYYGAPSASGGPGSPLGYGGYRWRRFPTYADLMEEADGQGVQRSYLATEASFAALKDLHARNLIVPIVGNFAGDKAIRSVGQFLQRRGSSVDVFYTSNVEQYLFRSDDWRKFYENVSALPVSRTSTFVRAVFNFGYQYQTAMPHGRSATLLCPITDLLAAVRNGRIQSYGDVVEMSK